MEDNRLVNQLSNMLASSNQQRFRTILVVEGSLSDIDTTKEMFTKHARRSRGTIAEKRESTKQRAILSNIRAEKMAFSMMVGLAIRDQIPVLRTDDLAETFRLITVIAEKYKDFLRTGPLQYTELKGDLPSPRRKEASDEMLFRYMLQTVPGISSKMSRALVDSIQPTSIQELIARISEADSVEVTPFQCVDRTYHKHHANWTLP